MDRIIPLFLALAGTVSSSIVGSDVSTQQHVFSDAVREPFEWAKLAPSRKLNYSSCYGGFECARMDVPLNWNGASAEQEEHRAAIAIIRLPAKVPVTHKNYGGAVILNPGGPGEPGIDQVLDTGRYLQTILDPPSSHSADSDLASDTRRYFDIVSFDPRGVNNSTPRLRCFPDASNQQMWLIQSAAPYGLEFESDTSLALKWAQTEAVAGSCAAEDTDDTASVIRHVNTAQVVEDMVELIERHGEWRSSEAERLMADEIGFAVSAQEQQRIRNRTAWKKGFETIQFWGTSYGSLLGQTFVAMHPDRAERILIDGIVDAQDYYSARYLLNLQDTDKIMTKLCEFCFDAGPQKCPMYTGDSAADIEVAVERLVFDLKMNPIAVPADGHGIVGPELIYFGDMILRSSGALAFPYKHAEDFFTVLADFSRGNYSSIVSNKQARLKPVRLSEQCQIDGPYSDACLAGYYTSLSGVNPAIECMDAKIGIDHELTKEEFKEYFEILQSQSKWYSPVWTSHKMCCVGFDQSPAWTYHGPISANTTHTMLIIGNTQDNATPLQNARRASTLFPNSVVLQQDSQGHCSHASPSVCTARHVREYFQTGALPAPGTVCEPEWQPFLGCTHKDKDGKCEKRSAEDQELWGALDDLAQTLP